MGVGGNFWDLLKPHARYEGFDFLRNKRVAVDLSYWIVQHETAIKGYTRKPHIRLMFFRTINLFSKFGAYPVFVLDGTPSPLKSQARIMRFFSSSGIEVSNMSNIEECTSVKRNGLFRKCVEECVELLQLMGIPILTAKAEAEALCAQLNREGFVDACITADSDAFLYGAQCVIKRIVPNSKEPFECYHISDIEAGLGLKREHLIAVSLLVGNDHDLKGIYGIGIDTAVRFVKHYSEDEILSRLHEIARKDHEIFDEKSPKNGKSPHCSHCGHPGSKKAHIKFSCEHCNSTIGQSCLQKPAGFRCQCSSCDLYMQEEGKRRDRAWENTVCRKIASEKNFPNDEILQMYLGSNHGIDDDPCLGWANPQTELLVDYLSYQQNWEPSYIRQRLLPMLSTIYLRDMASNKTNKLLHGQYEFHGIHRIKRRYGHESYVVNWKKAVDSKMLSDTVRAIPEGSDDTKGTINEEKDDFIDLVEEPEVPYIRFEDGCCLLSTDEDMELVRNAFPEETCLFLKEKELKEAKSRKKKSASTHGKSPEISESSQSVQLSITEFYRSSKKAVSPEDEMAQKKISQSSFSSPEGKRKGSGSSSSSKISKSVRRRLLFD